MQATIDRFEGNMAVLEFPDKTMKDVPRHLLPSYAKEGDVVRETNGQYVIMEGETKDRAREIRDLMDDVWED